MTVSLVVVQEGFRVKEGFLDLLGLRKSKKLLYFNLYPLRIFIRERMRGFLLFHGGNRLVVPLSPTLSFSAPPHPMLIKAFIWASGST